MNRPVPVLQIQLRRAIASDAAAVTHCVLQAYSPWVVKIGQKPGPMLDDYAQVIAKESVYLAEVKDTLAGVLVLACTDEGFLLENIAVAPDFKGTGVGRSLLAFAEDEARAAGFNSIYLYTHEKMQRNIELYTRIGYVEFDRREEIGLRRVYMRKIL